ncbi:MAG: hypothetical protein COT26_01805 [Candidatus Kerfeldbacteria bacterium CG08_land_8_20_14_0_20_43_14]|uniref:Uncharacterized protein n=1 Tax=Candidatus Kerfeldbacteria bacterium CG08_land_8_20_14_0_20_43_14 TaxID=2014246 RepID=A0A2H0YSK2_9BACT|nr:MAG: hypothetical protein COT26_01805 [Candidatus Kerfeldbacteria bacterium CG08_land_8_20_14_0_20_43_14]
MLAENQTQIAQEVYMPLSMKHVDEVCKWGKKGTSCRYLTFGGDFECAKTDPALKRVIDERSAADSMKAQGYNCEGVKS